MPKSPNLSALSLIAILVCSVVVLAQKPVQTSTPTSAVTEDSTDGTINGSTIAEGGQPLQGVTVFLRAAHPGGVGRASTSNSEGNFKITGLGPGLYSLSAFLPGYVTPPMDFASPDAYHRIGDTVRLEFIRGGVITGTVTNAAGEPVIGVSVRARMVRTAKGDTPRLAGFVSSERTTDD